MAQRVMVYVQRADSLVDETSSLDVMNSACACASRHDVY